MGPAGPPPAHLPVPLRWAPPPQQGHRGKRGLSLAPRRRGLRAEGSGYPPVAPDTNEHMAEAAPGDQRASGRGTAGAARA